jgi:outer membrane protein, heavy metal efflux system
MTSSAASSPFAAAMALLLLTGCVTVSSDAGLAEVRSIVEERNRGEWQVELNGPFSTVELRERLAHPVDVEEVVQLAMANNPRLGAIVAELGVARADLIDAATISNPIFGAEIGFPADPYRPFELSITQSLLELIQLRRRSALGRLAFTAAEQRTAAEILAFGAEVRDDYWMLLAATRHVALGREVAEAARIAAELAQRQHRAGNISDLDLENEQALYEQTKIDLARSEEQLLVQHEALTRHLGLRGSEVEWTIRTEFPSPPPATLPAGETAALTAERRIDLAMARAAVDLARKARPLTRGAAIGDIGVGVHHEREAEGHRFTGPGIHFPIPIFGRGRAARLRAESQLLLAERQLETLSIAAESDVRTAVQRLDAARARLDYYGAVIVPRRERILRLTQLEYNAMFAGVFQLLQARQNLAQAHRDLIDAERDYWMARNDLDRVLNGISPVDHGRGRTEGFSPALPANVRRGDPH